MVMNGCRIAQADAKHGLLIANLDVPHCQHEQKLAVGPQLAQIQRAPATDRLDYGDMLMPEVALVQRAFRERRRRQFALYHVRHGGNDIAQRRSDCPGRGK